MSAHGASIWDKTHPYPDHTGKLYGPASVGSSASPFRSPAASPAKVGQPTDNSGKLNRRMKADDSKAANVSDQSLSDGIRLTGGLK